MSLFQQQDKTGRWNICGDGVVVARQGNPAVHESLAFGEKKVPKVTFILKVGNVSENLSEQPLPRGKVIFGTPGKYLRDIAIANNAHFGLNEEDKAEMIVMTDEIPEGSVLKLTPMTGLVGTPRYTDSGIQIKMLLEPRIRIKCLVKIDNEIIQRQLVSVSNTNQGPKANGVNQKTQFDEDGEYQVLSYAHSMDTWGDDWTTEVVAFSRNGRVGLPVMMQTKSQNVM
jgi:hypothetical protein